jgi:HCOMODA/2-hydroxy-3-carboxy-muconic semialdehyde decarboxylase
MKIYLSVLGCALLLAVVALAQNGQPINSPQIPDLVIANHILANEGVLDAYGHVSVRDERNPTHYLMSRSMPPLFVQASDIVEYDADSKPINDTRPLFNERFIHGEIYRLRPDVKAIVHFHAPEVVTFSVGNIPLRPMVHMAGFLPQDIPIFDIKKAAGITDMLVRNNDLGKMLAERLDDKPLALLRGHGAVVVAPTVKLLTGRAYYTMVNARAQAQAITLFGKDKVIYLDPGEAAKAGDQDGFERGWTYWSGKVADNKK